MTALVRFVSDPDRFGAMVWVATDDRVYEYDSFIEAHSHWRDTPEVRDLLLEKEAEWMRGVGLDAW